MTEDERKMKDLNKASERLADAAAGESAEVDSLKEEQKKEGENSTLNTDVGP